MPMGRRRRRKNGVVVAKNNNNCNIDDSLDWCDDDNDNDTTKRRAVIRVQEKKNKLPISSTNPKNTPSLLKPSIKKTPAKTPLSKRTKSVVTPSTLSPRSTSKTASNSNSNRGSRSRRHIHHCLLVDSRTLDTDEGKLVSNHFLSHITSILQVSRQRGAYPECIGFVGSAAPSPTNFSPRQQRSPAMAAKLANWDSSDATTAVPVLRPMLIKPPINFANKHNRSAVKIPMRLLAHASWKIFGDLVVEAATARSNHGRMPLSITLVTNDVTLLCDISGQSHKQEIIKFWKTIRPHFHSSKIRSIDLIIVETGVIVLSNRSKTATADVSNSNEETPPGDGDGRNDAEGEEKKDEETANVHTSKITQTIQLIREHLDHLADEDFKEDRDREVAVTPVSVYLSVVENSPHTFHSLARKWVNEILVPPATASSSTCLTFELPESLEAPGTQCSVSFDVKYKILPFKADSVAAAGMMADLKLLCGGGIEVAQLVPLPCIDASLIFGIPIALTPAFEHDLAQYNEMKALVHFMCKYLAERQVALLLRSTVAAATVPGKTRCSDAEEPSSLFHMDGQTFLLMAEEAPGADLATLSQQVDMALPIELMLFRYAFSDQILDVGSDELGRPDPGSEELGDYVMSALDCLETNAVNPLLVINEDSIRARTSNISLDDESADADQDTSPLSLADKLDFVARETNDAAIANTKIGDSTDENVNDEDSFQAPKEAEDKMETSNGNLLLSQATASVIAEGMDLEMETEKEDTSTTVNGVPGGDDKTNPWNDETGIGSSPMNKYVEYEQPINNGHPIGSSNENYDDGKANCDTTAGCDGWAHAATAKEQASLPESAETGRDATPKKSTASFIIKSKKPTISASKKAGPRKGKLKKKKPPARDNDDSSVDSIFEAVKVSLKQPQGGTIKPRLGKKKKKKIVEESSSSEEDGDEPARDKEYEKLKKEAMELSSSDEEPESTNQANEDQREQVLTESGDDVLLDTDDEKSTKFEY